MCFRERCRIERHSGFTEISRTIARIESGLKSICQTPLLNCAPTLPADMSLAWERELWILYMWLRHWSWAQNISGPLTNDKRNWPTRWASASPDPVATVTLHCSVGARALRKWPNLGHRSECKGILIGTFFAHPRSSFRRASRLTFARSLWMFPSHVTHASRLGRSFGLARNNRMRSITRTEYLFTPD